MIPGNGHKLLFEPINQNINVRCATPPAPCSSIWSTKPVLARSEDAKIPSRELEPGKNKMPPSCRQCNHNGETIYLSHTMEMHDMHHIHMSLTTSRSRGHDMNTRTLLVTRPRHEHYQPTWIRHEHALDAGGYHHRASNSEAEHDCREVKLR